MQIPDIDAIMHTSDFSCIPATPGGQEPAGPPIFGYNSDPAHEDVPFPDYSYWGHEYTRLRGDCFARIMHITADHVIPVTVQLVIACWEGPLCSAGKE